MSEPPDEPAPTASDPERRLAIEAILLDEPGTTARRMFGTTAYLQDDRLIAFWSGSALVVKVPATLRADLLRAGLAEEFVLPSGQSFGDRIQLPLTAPVDWAAVIAAARDRVLTEVRPARRRGRRRFRPPRRA